MVINSVTIIGTGNVAKHFARRFYEKGIKVNQVFGRDSTKTETLAFEVDAQPITEYNLVTANSDLYFVAVSDDSIEEVFRNIDGNFNDKIIAHSSGSSSLVNNLKSNYSAVFYPLQTFSKSRYANFKKIPLLVESTNNEVEQALLKLAAKISKSYQIVTEEQRGYLHMAAVFMNNFTNHLFEVSEGILKSKNLDFNLLNPLLKETIKKVEQLGPYESQTGPALRNDQKTIQKHLSLLEGDEKLQDIYKCFTENIQKTHHA